MAKNHLSAIIILVALVGVSPVSAQERYVVGVSGAITGRGAETYAPGVESLKLYVDNLNKRGGVNGKPLSLVVRDNQGEPSRAAADAKSFVSQDNLLLMVNVGPSSTYGPMAAESQRSKIPLLFAGAACPDEALPPNAAELQFCSIGAASKYDAEMALGFIKEQSKEPVKLGLVAMAIPVSRSGIDHAESIAHTFNITVVDKELIPPTTADYTPFATKLKSAKPDWVFSWAPWVTEIKTFEALRLLGWGGRFLGGQLNPTEGELGRVKDAGLFIVAPNAMFVENLPVHQEIRKAAREANVTYPATELAEGWIAGMVIEQAFAATPLPVTPAKLLATMTTLKVDTKGLRGGPIEWTKTNHFRTRQYYRIYRWDDKSKAVVMVKDWVTIELK